MDKLKKFFTKFFIYNEPAKTHNFLLSPSLCSQSNSSNDNKKISSSLNTNLNYIQKIYKTKINSDVIFRNFKIKINNKFYKSFLFCIDGMVNSELINNFTLRPLMITSKRLFESNENTSLKMQSNLENYLYNSLIPQNSINKCEFFSNVFSNVNSGCCAIFVDTLSIAYIIDVKGFPSRSISTANNEIIIRGSQEAFVEKLRTNTSMLRRIINNENLVIEDTSVGKITKTKIAICYLSNIANNKLVNEVKYRINNLGIDSLFSSGQLEQLIQDDSNIIFPQMIATERPDKACEHILSGRVAILVNGNPYALIAPGILIDFLSSPEDKNLKNQYSNALKFLRILSSLITLLLPGIYIAIVNFHSELLPTELLFTIAASRNSVPFPVIVEILLMEISFELIREAGLRVPTPLGTTIGIVGALILGEAAVSASLVSPILIIIVAITGICSFAIPDFSFGFSLRIFRFLYITLGYVLGFLGIAVGIFVQLSMLANLKSFGVPYLAPYVMNFKKNKSFSYFLPPIWKNEKRPEFLYSKRKNQEDKISMKWKYLKGKLYKHE